MITHCSYCNLSTAGEHEQNCPMRNPKTVYLCSEPVISKPEDFQTKDVIISDLRRQLDEKDRTITAMHCSMAEKDKEIARLKKAIQEAGTIIANSKREGVAKS